MTTPSSNVGADASHKSVPEKLSRQETREYLTDLEWEECELCEGTGCEKCNHEGIVWETVNGVA